MTNDADLDRLLDMLKEVLEEVDRQHNTLVAALLVECMEAIERSHRGGGSIR